MPSHQPIPMITAMAALGDPTRFAIVERLLRDGEVSAGELAMPFAMSKPAISRHLKVLEGAGLIERQTRAQFRVFRARPVSFRRMNDWLKQYRQFWETSFDRLDQVLENMPDNKNHGNGEKD